jgi:hypothetical protein
MNNKKCKICGSTEIYSGRYCELHFKEYRSEYMRSKRSKGMYVYERSTQTEKVDETILNDEYMIEILN